MTTTDDDAANGYKTFPALNLLERRAWPTLYGNKAYGRAPIPEPARKHPFVPSWNWTGVHELADDDKPITLDVNGAFMAALGGVQVAFNHLDRVSVESAGNLRPRQVLPGYYKITVPHWAFSGTIVSPLGDSARLQTETEIWIAHPTLILLLELAEANVLGPFEILDAWISRKVCDFRQWNVLLKQVRGALLDQRDTAEGVDEYREFLARYKAFKEGYGSAFSMMLTGEKCNTRRPDWAHAVYAQHAATCWRKAWKFTAIGPMLAMGTTDEITVLNKDLLEAVQRVSPIYRLDPSGRQLGHLKEKKPEPKPEPSTTAHDVILTEDYEDVL